MDFNPGQLEKVQRWLGSAQRHVIEAQNHCKLAKAALEDAGRQTQAVALEMICESLTQSEKDIVRWHDLTYKTRENGNGN